MSNTSVVATQQQKKTIVILFEDEKRTSDLVAVLVKKNIRYELLNLSTLDFNLFAIPHKDKIYYNRVSAGSFSRNNLGSPSMARILLHWLLENNCTVINGPNALDLEVSKAAQIMTLRKHKIRTPKTLVCIKNEGIQNALTTFDANEKVVIKPNQGGSGKYIEAFDNPQLAMDNIESRKMFSADGLFIVQSYVYDTVNNPPEQPQTRQLNIRNNRAIAASGVGYRYRQRLYNQRQFYQRRIPRSLFTHPTPDYAYRLEIIGDVILYVLRIDASKGFELCPCDAVQSDPRFEILLYPEELPIDNERFLRFRQKCLAICQAEGIGTCAFEFKIDKDGAIRVYDININTNYNHFAEEKAQTKYGNVVTVPKGLDLLAEFLLQQANL